MNKFTKKVVGKRGLFLAIALVIIVAGIVIGAIFGFNAAPAYDDVKTVTVKVTSYYTEDRVNEVKKICDDEFSSAKISPLFTEVDVSTSLNNYEVVYCFKAKETADFAAIKTSIETKLNASATATGENQTALSGLQSFLRVSINSKEAVRTATNHFALRASIAGAVLLVVVFVYMALRHKLAAGCATLLMSLTTLALTAALTAICRIPFYATSVNAWFISLLFGAVFGTIVAGKTHEAEKEGAESGKSAEEITIEGAGNRTLFVLSAGILLGTILIGAMGITPTQWFAVLVLLGLVSAFFTAGVLYPAVYPSVLTKLLASRAAKRRYDYAKKAKAPKKNKKGGEETATEEAPAENVAAEEVKTENAAEESAENGVENNTEDTAE